MKPTDARTRRISAKAWDAAFAYVAERRGLTVDKAAAMRIEGACVGAVVEPTSREPVPGVALELRVSGPAGELRYRITVGKPTVEDAIAASLDYVVGFAMAISK